MIPAARLSDPTVRRSIEDQIERLIALLDYVEPDPDLEPWLAGGTEVVGTGDREGDATDLEPSLGWTSTGALGNVEDLEGNLADSATASLRQTMGITTAPAIIWGGQGR